MFREYLGVLAKAKRFDELARECDAAIAKSKRLENTAIYRMMRGVAKAGAGDKEAAATDFVAALDLAESGSRDAVVDEVLALAAEWLGNETALARAAMLKSANTPHRLVMYGYLQLQAQDIAGAEKTAAALEAKRDRWIDGEKRGALLFLDRSTCRRTAAPKPSRFTVSCSKPSRTTSSP